MKVHLVTIRDNRPPFDADVHTAEIPEDDLGWITCLHQKKPNDLVFGQTTAKNLFHHLIGYSYLDRDGRDYNDENPGPFVDDPFKKFGGQFKVGLDVCPMFGCVVFFGRPQSS